MTYQLKAQNVGIGLSDPQAKLTIFDPILSGTLYQTEGTTASDGFFVGMQSSKQARIMNFENAGLSLGTFNTNHLNITSTGFIGIGLDNPQAKLTVFDPILAGTLYQTSGTTASNGFFVGMQSSNKAQIMNFENASIAMGTSGLERLTILSNGNVGIGTTNPNFKFQVNGNSYFSSYVGIGDATPEFPLDVNGGASIDYLGINTNPNASFRLDVNGNSRIQNSLTINGVLNPDNMLNIGSNTSIDGKLTVNNNNGIVRSSNATQLRTELLSTPANLTIPNWAPGNQGNFLLVYGGSFSSPPVVAVGNWVDPDGTLGGSSATGLENLSITVLDVTTNNATIRLKNVGNTNVNMQNMVLQFIVTGAE